MRVSSRRILSSFAVSSLILGGFLGRMSWSVSGLSERAVIWETPELSAYLHSSPWTPGVAVVTHKSFSSTASLFHLPEEAFLRLLLGGRSVAHLLCESLAVHRCALVHTPHSRTGAQLLVVPLHGLHSEWKPHLAAEDDFQTHDPGYVSSKSGPRWTDADLEAVRSRIRAKLPNTAPNYTFLGDPSDPGLFPRIVRGEEKQWRVWEDEEHVAFLTPFPNTPGLTVLVPRKPLSSDIFRLEEDDYRRLALASRKVSGLLEAGLGAWGVGLIFEGFEIDYAHAKLIPLVSPPDEAQMSLSCPAPEFFDHYPGYVTSVSGPPASRESLQEICARVTQR